jgi:hypothetical protein
MAAGLIKGKQVDKQTITVSGDTGNVIVVGDLNLNGHNAISTTEPTNDSHLVNKKYVDTLTGLTNSAITSNIIIDYIEYFMPTVSGNTNAVLVTNSAFNYTSGSVILNSIDIFMNGLRYNFGTTQGNVAFYANVTGSKINLYFDSVYATIQLDTDDYITLKYSTKGI